MARRWRGPIAVENEQTGDGRVIAAGAIEWSDDLLPLPLAWIVDGDQHIDLTEMAPQVGTMDRVWRDGDTVWAEGLVDDEQPIGAELVRRMDAGTAGHGHRQLLSIDPDNWAVEYLARDEGDDGVLMAGAGPLPMLRAAAGDPDPGTGGEYVVLFADEVDSVLMRMTRLRLRGVTACAVSAFAGAWMELVADDAEADDDATPDEDDAGDDDATTAAATRTTRTTGAPPRDFFAIPEPQPGDTGMVDVYGMPVDELLVTQPDGGLGVPFTVVEMGGHLVCYGHAARWGQCHVGYLDDCVTAPESPSAYAHFHHGTVVCADGSQIATGTLTMGCDHAAAELRAPEARDHYAHQGLGFADVRATNGTLGAWTCGVLRPDVTDAQLRLIRASSLSGDWRRIGTDLEFIGALAVNVPGFPIARESVLAAGLTVMAAAGAPRAWWDAGTQTSLVASGVVQRCSDCQRRAQQALAAGAAEPDRRMLDLLEKIELRTRHLRDAQADAALSRLRR